MPQLCLNSPETEPAQQFGPTTRAAEFRIVLKMLGVDVFCFNKKRIQYLRISYNDLQYACIHTVVIDVGLIGWFTENY